MYSFQINKFNINGTFRFDYLFSLIAFIGLEQTQCATRELNLKSI